MKNQSSIIFFFFFLSVLAFATAVRKEPLVVGGWTPIKNINDPHVIEIAKFAVTEHDKFSGQKLSFVKNIKGETQVVSGTNYRIVLAATNGSGPKNYEAVVWEKSWINFRNLTSFKSVA